MSTWIKLGIVTTTPLFSGDDTVYTPASTAVRVPSIRGQLRYWFRTLATAHGLTDPAALWEREQAVFGSTHTPGRIALRIDNPPTLQSPHRTPKWAQDTDKPFSGRHYLLGQGLWDNKTGLTRGYLDRGQGFTLRIKPSSDPTLNALFFYSLWAWLTFGALGARSRRGFGQLRLDTITDFPECGWSTEPSALQTRPETVEGWQQLAANPVPTHAPPLPENTWGSSLTPVAALSDPPELPALTPPWWGGRVLPVHNLNNFGAALDHAGETWRRFLIRNTLFYSDHRNKQHPNASPEFEAVLIGEDTRYPRGALGLPVGYFRREGGGYPQFSATVSVDTGRRASPFWLRPIELTPGTWAVFTHAFRSRFLPANARVTVGTRQLQVTDTMVADAHEAWLTNTRNPTPRIRRDYFT